MTTFAAAVGQALADSGIRHAFGVVGGGNILATAALTAGGVHYTAARHEGGAMAMADAYYRASGEVALCTTTHGPGLANVATPLAEAVKNRSAVVLLCGDAPVDRLRPHDIDQTAFIAALGARVVRLTDPSTARRQVTAAVRAAVDEQVPVAVLLPGDLLGAPVATDRPADALPLPQAAPRPAAAGPEALHAMLTALTTARRPLILAGLGAWRAQAGKILIDLGDRLGALFSTTVMANGLFRGSPWDIGVCGGFASPPAAELIGGADVVIAFGARLDPFTLHGGRLIAPGATVIQVDVAGGATAERVDLAVQGDAAAVAAQLLDAVDRSEASRASDWRRQAADRVAAVGWDRQPHRSRSTAHRIDPRTLSAEVAKLLPPERTVVTDGGHFIGWPAMYWPVPDPAAMVFTGASFQAIGLGFAGAVGAAVGRPDRTTVVAVGDGGALMGLSELETLIRSARSALVVVYDDASYGFEEHMYLPQGADRGTTCFADTDFAGVARALGADAVTVRTVEDLAAVRRWREAGCRGTLVLDCKIVGEVVAPYLADLLEAA